MAGKSFLNSLLFLKLIVKFIIYPVKQIFTIGVQIMDRRFDLLLVKHDKILGAFEIKITKTVASPHLSGLRSFRQENPEVPCFVICNTKDAYQLDKIKILPWTQYLDRLPKLLL